MKKSKANAAFDIINISFTILLVIIMIYPMYFVIITSFSKPGAVFGGKVSFFPVGFNLDAYRSVFEDVRIWIGYRNSLFYTIAGTAYDVILTISAAYVLSKKYLPGRILIAVFFFVTMYFSGGMIPSYILIKDLGLLESPWVLIIGSVSCYNIIVARSYFDNSIPGSLYEAAEIDGASEWQRFTRIALPLAAPIIAVICLFQAVAHWNSYYSALLYIHKRTLYPLQLILREILITNQMELKAILSEASATEDVIEAAQRKYEMALAMRYSIVFIASAPLLIAYPFVQKYFIKGVMIGSVKG